MKEIFLWIVCVLSTIWLIDCINDEEPEKRQLGAFAAVVVFVTSLGFLGVYTVSDIMIHWQLFLGGIAAYLMLGIAWTWVKWCVFVNNWTQTQMRNLDKCKETFLSDLGHKIDKTLDSIPEEYVADFERWAYGSYITPEGTKSFASCPEQYRLKNISTISVVYNIPRLMTHCIYWPFSVLWTVINDPFRKLAHFLIVNVFVGLFSSVQERSAKTINQKMKSFTKPKA